MTEQAAQPRIGRFIALYALANVGAFLCFVPLIGLFLPQRALAIAPDTGVRLLSWILLAGAIGSSLANLAGGWISDRLIRRHGSRLPMVSAGLAMTLASFVALALAATPWMLMAAFLLFQICFNMLFAPFNALAADHIDDAMKGRAFGLLSLALPCAQLSVVAIVGLEIQGMAERLALVGLLVAAAILPLLLVGKAAAGPVIEAAPRAENWPSAIEPEVGLKADFVRAWIARLLIQCAAVAGGSYLLVHLAQAGRAGREAETWFAALSLIALIIGPLVGLLVGRWSDALTRRRPFLWVTALLVMLGAATLGLSQGWPAVAAGYAIFAIGLTGFITIDGALIAQLVGQRGKRGMRLGLMNLTNTLPALLVPIVALLANQEGEGVTELLFLAVAAGASIAAILVAKIKTIR